MSWAGIVGTGHRRVWDEFWDTVIGDFPDLFGAIRKFAVYSCLDMASEYQNRIEKLS